MPDAYQLLSDEHREIEKLLSQYDSSPDDATARAIGEALTTHAEIEERLVYPELRRLVDGGDDLADDAQAEHAAVKLLIARMLATPPEDLRPLVEAIGQAVAPHVEQEERTIFPAMQEAGVDAEGLGSRLESARTDTRENGRVEELVDRAKADNPDSETRRETFELDLIEEDRSEQGESTQLADDTTNAP